MSEGEAAAAVADVGAVDAPVAEAPSAAADLAVAGAPPEGGETTPAWAQGLDAESVAFIESRSWNKAENPLAEAVKGYRNIERLRGVNAEQLVRIPEAGNEEQLAEWRTRMGIPESPEGYQFGDLQAQGKTVDTAPLSQIAHAMDATPDQVAKLGPAVVQFLEQTQEAQAAERTARLSAEKVELDQSWGPEREANMIAARKGFDTIANALGWDAESLSSRIDAAEDAWGYAATMQLGALIGRLTSEPTRGDSQAPSNESAFGLTRESARAQLQTRGQELVARIKGGDQAAKRELEHLNEVAFHS